AEHHPDTHCSNECSHTRSLPGWASWRHAATQAEHTKIMPTPGLQTSNHTLRRNRTQRGKQGAGCRRSQPCPGPLAARTTSSTCAQRRELLVCQRVPGRGHSTSYETTPAATSVTATARRSPRAQRHVRTFRCVCLRVGGRDQACSRQRWRTALSGGLI